MGASASINQHWKTYVAVWLEHCVFLSVSFLSPFTAFQYTTGFYFCTEVFLLSRYAEGEIPSFFLKLLLK